MTKGLLLVGASGLAREVLAAGITGVVGIVDDNPELLDTEVAGIPVVGTVADAGKRDETLLVCIGPSAGRRNLVRRLHNAGVTDDRFGTYIAQSVRIGKTSAVGVGSILLDGVVVTADAVIGRHVVVMPHCVVTHDCALDDFATLAAGVAMGGGVHIREAAYVGMNASLRQGITVGSGAIVGMSAAVIADVPSDQIWAGVPARQLKVDQQ